MNNILKSLPTGTISSVYRHPTNDELATINTRTQREYTADELYVLTVHLCNSQKDKVNDIMTDTFLEEFAARAQANNLPGQLNHNEDVKETWANIFEAHVEEVADYKEIVGLAYVVINDDNQKLLNKIEAGTIGNISVSFNGQGTQVGDTYIWEHCDEAREFSLVVVPCQEDAYITKDHSTVTTPQSTVDDKAVSNNDTNNTGGKRMKAIDRFKALIKKSMDEAGDTSAVEITPSLLPLLEDPDHEMSDIEIALQEENEQLKAELAACKEEYEAKIKELEDKLTEHDDEAKKTEEEAIDTLVDAEVDKLNPLTPTVKSNMLRDIDRAQLRLNAGKVEGLTEQLEAIKKSYDGLFGKKESTEQKKPFMSVSVKKTQTKAASFKEACQNSFND